MLRATAIIFLSIIVAEASVMLAFETLAIEWSEFWMEPLIDAVTISIVAIITIRWIIKRAIFQINHSVSLEWVQLKTALIVFGVEIILMLTITLMPEKLSVWQTIVFDAVILAIFSTAGIYIWILVPFRQQPSGSHAILLALNSPWSISLLSYLFGITLLLLFLLSVYKTQEQDYETYLVDHEEANIVLAKSIFIHQLSNAILQTLILARQQNLQTYLTGDSSDRYILSRDYLSITHLQDNYEQMRYLDSSGQEIIRIDRRNNQPFVVPEENLQNKQSRYYFQNTIALDSGETYVSPMDLNVEHGQIERPFKPIIRLATPVVDTAGNKTGIFIINLKGKSLIDLINKVAPTLRGELMLLNEEGYWLRESAHEKEWGFMFPGGKQYRIQNEFPEAWASIKNNNAGFIKTKNDYFIYQTIDLKADQTIANAMQHGLHDATLRYSPAWKLVSHVTPPATFKHDMDEKRTLLVMFFLLAVIVSGAGTIMYTRAQVKRELAEKQIKYLAHYDSLTGLDNRALFMEKLTLELAHSTRSGVPLTLMYLDLDRFKPVNDELGHEAGDAVLREVSKRLLSCLRKSDTVARLGGDEFSVILPNAGNKQTVSQIAQKILDAFAQDFHPLGHHCSLGVSIGIAYFHDETQSLDDLLHKADMAMYEAKQDGRNCYRYADDEG
jgi:diguanylate cyclase (GGDEF)-like protein